MPYVYVWHLAHITVRADWLAMSWYDPGGGAGVWSEAIINPSMKNILHELCYAVFERECIKIGTGRKIISSITRSGTTATVTTSTTHGLTSNDKVTIRGSDQSDYNGVKTVTVTDTTHFTFAVPNTVTTPATGNMFVYPASTKFTYNNNGDKKHAPDVSDFEGMEISKIGNGPDRTVYGTITASDLSSVLTLVTVTCSSTTSLVAGETIEISGLNESAYNGIFTIASIVDGTHFTYIAGSNPSGSPATGTPTIKQHGRLTAIGTAATMRLPMHGFNSDTVFTIAGASDSAFNGAFTGSNVTLPAISSITRSGSIVTVTFASAHGLSANDVIIISGCVETQYNGVKTLRNAPSSTTVTFTVIGTPSSPATGSPVAQDKTRITFTLASAPASSPATGDIKCTANRNMIGYAAYGGGSISVQCYEHGFSNGDQVEVINTHSGYTDYSFYGTITTAGTNAFLFTASAPSLSEWSSGGAGVMYVVREGVFRRLLRELQAAIGGLVSGTVTKFVQDDSVYETAWTNANDLLDDTSYSSPWLSLLALQRNDLDDVLLQMREALDLLVIYRCTLAQSSASGHVKTGTGVTTGSNDSRVEDAWDTMAAASSSSTSAGYLRVYFLHRLVSVPNDFWQITVDDDATFQLDERVATGDFLEGKVVMTETHTTQAAVNANPSAIDSFDVNIDNDAADVLTLNVGTNSSQTHDVILADADTPEEGAYFSLNFNAWGSSFADLPADSPATLTGAQGGADGDATFRKLEFSSGYVVRELVPGTHLVYG